MKVTVIILAGTIGMAGCTIMGHRGSGQGVDSGFPLSYAGQKRSEHASSAKDKDHDWSSGFQDDQCSHESNVNKPNTYPSPSCHDGQVPVLDPKIEKIVGEAAKVDHIAFIAVVSSDGKRPGILRPNSAIKSRKTDVIPDRKSVV